MGPRTGQREQRLGHRAQGDERQVGHHHVEAAAEVVAAQAPQVGPFPHRDAGIGAQPLVELVATHVERHHVRRAALEDAVGEAARGRAGVEHPEPGHVDAELVEGGVELLTAARRRTGGRAR